MTERIWHSFLTERDRKVFERFGCGTRGSLRKRPAVLVIDMTHDFVGDRPEPALESIKRRPNSSGEESWAANAVSGLFATPLMPTLTQLGANSLIVTGCTTRGCVRASVVDAFSYNLRVAVVEEGCFDRSQASHAMTLCDFDAEYADVLPASEVLALMDGLSADLFELSDGAPPPPQV